ncbi:MAG: hypothetical protein LBR05_05310 [Azoarcus sp.]|jgi:hypothetical protein|nr:hypothetical protein [Azoarcus sp.]
MISAVSPSFAHDLHSASNYGSSMRGDSSTKSTAGATEELSEEDLRRVEKLKTTDRKVRAHEAAHMAAGGGMITHGATYTYETGPDGKKYAVAGEVGIDTSKGRTPEETLQRAQQIRAAALAPADPSGQDRRVAAEASQMAAEARVEIARANAEKANGDGEDDGGRAGSSGSGDASGRGEAFGQAIENSLSPTAGQSFDIYA